MFGTLGTPETNSKFDPQRLGTLGTPKSELVSTRSQASQVVELDFGTLGTGNFYPYAHAREKVIHTHDVAHTCKDWEKGVLSVPSVPRPGTADNPPEPAGMDRGDR